jgi:hypothetical protein
MLSRRELSIQKLHEPNRRLPRPARPALDGPDARSATRQATYEAMQSGEWSPTVMPAWVGRPRHQCIKRVTYWRATDIAWGGANVLCARDLLISRSILNHLKLLTYAILT